MSEFIEVLREQRWDDHRYYHHSRINQSLHLVSALSFLFAYVMVFKDPAVAALVGWLVAMTSRQVGHFFFEPRDYDVANDASHEYKEEIKVGYNLRRKVVSMAIWILSPVPLYFDPTFFGIFSPHANVAEFVRHVAQIWLAIGAGGLLFRTIQLFFVRARSDRTGLGHENPDRPVPRHQALPPGAAPFVAGRIHRYRNRSARLVRGRR